ncbi:MAG: homocysteine S-methyltransferase family protein [Candidatus Aerophobus sp.]|nr:MAG: homocysteine S-methyltransferase family protein [Candidatus Aerophobus sp.]
MTRDWKKRLFSRGILVLDGAWGTEMIKRGLVPGECPELWNLDRPDDIRAIARAYREAGADIILTNTFGGNYFKLKKAGVSSKVREINRKGVELSKEIAEDSLVFASIGPTGEFLKPLGMTAEDEMISCFSEQVKAFVEGGADGVIVETMTDLNEAKCALKAVRENSNLSVAVSMTFNKGERGYATMMGVTPGKAVVELEKAGADIVGANCGSGIENMVEIACIIRSATTLPLWIKPNAGSPQLEEGKTVYRETPEEMARLIPDLIKAGVSMIGGCCGTTPEHIRLIAKEVPSYVDIAHKCLETVIKFSD